MRLATTKAIRIEETPGVNTGEGALRDRP